MIDWENDARWMAQGVCAQIDPDLFFPDKGGGSVHAAKRMCRRCPVIDECREWAIVNIEIEGVLGGMTHTERRKEHRSRRNG